MASRHHQTESQAGSTGNFELPEGFARSGSANAVGWFDHTTLGNMAMGKLVGMFRRPDQLKGPKGESDFFQIELAATCKVREGKGEDAEIVDAKAGDVININYGPKTKVWQSLIADILRGAVYEVIARVEGEKVPISGGRKMHNLGCYQHCVRPAPAESEVDTDFPGSAEDQPGA
jgi:hypothetical protein